MKKGISRKYYIEVPAPTKEDNRSYQERILETLKVALDDGEQICLDTIFMRKLYPVCDQADWRLTVSLVWDGYIWHAIDLEAGDCSQEHYGLALDLGSTTIVGRLINCYTGECIYEESTFNKQIRFGTDILNRIFYSKDQPEKLEEIRQDTIDSMIEVIHKLEDKTGISSEQCLQMTVGGNTTMIHFLIGLDAFCVFASPYSVRADQPGFLLGKDLGIPIPGYVYCFPSKSNYLGGDILSGMIATELYKEENICAFFDIGTNGELVIGNRDFILCGAGAAGPALEGAVVRTGMRATAGAVQHVKIRGDKIRVEVITEETRGCWSEIGPEYERKQIAKGICGSGIIDLIAELFLNGWIDFRGNFVPEKSALIQLKTVDEEIDKKLYAVEYSPGLFFYQDDIEEFIRTKSAAYTMVEYMLLESGITPEQLEKFYVCGAFGKHVSKESAITIGMYPDMDRTHIINAGNSSLEGAQKLLLNKDYLKDLDEILANMTYIQYGEVENFVQMMTAARFLPHIDLERYPSVKEKLLRFTYQ